MKKTPPVFAILLFAALLFTAVPSASAQLTIVPTVCQDGSPTQCGFCELAQSLKNATDILIMLSGPLVAGFLAWAGFMFMTATGSEERISNAKKIATSAVIGLIIVVLSWLFINTLLNVVFQANIAPWNDIDCSLLVLPGSPTAPPAAPPVTTTSTTATSTASCSDPKALAAANNVPYPAIKSPKINQVINCVKSQLNTRGKGNWIDQVQIYTYEIGNDGDPNNNLCNFTRGVPICGDCAHSKYSCHYGGKTGTTGADGVDFNANLSVTTEAALCREIANIKINCGYSFVNWEIDHTHISAPTCDSDQGKTGTACPSP